MSVPTTYEDARQALKDKLEECLKISENLVMSKDVFGHAEMRRGYAIDVYQTIQKAIETVENHMC